MTIGSSLQSPEIDLLETSCSNFSITSPQVRLCVPSKDGTGCHPSLVRYFSAKVDKQSCRSKLAPNRVVIASLKKNKIVQRFLYHVPSGKIFRHTRNLNWILCKKNNTKPTAYLEFFERELFLEFSSMIAPMPI